MISLFDKLLSLKGEIYRQQKGRTTQRITLDGKRYFIKQFRGEGLFEIIKNLVQGRLPILSAKHEWRAIHKLQSLGILVPKVIAYGAQGTNPAAIKSYILMEELVHIKSLEDLAKHYHETKTSPSFALKYHLIKEIARIAKALHENGMNHRDFYLCHFLLEAKDGIKHLDLQNLKLYLIDLHRSQIRRLTPTRWIIKDLSSLYFSSMDVPLTQRDLFRFMKAYRERPLRVILETDGAFWQRVSTRGRKLYQHENASQ
jgi:heptose I phosphotransferase